MAKFHGVIAYAITEETSPGVWTERIVRHNHVGDVSRLSRSMQNGQSINDNLVIQNVISVVADRFAYDNFMNIRYVEWWNSKWKVSSVEVRHPRLVITLGGVYNE